MTQASPITGTAPLLPGRVNSRPTPQKEFHMLKLFVTMANFLAQPIRRDDRGATAVEYGLMVALIAAVIVTTVGLLGAKLNTLFTSVTGSI